MLVAALKYIANQALFCENFCASLIFMYKEKKAPQKCGLVRLFDVKLRIYTEFGLQYANKAMN